MTSGPRLWQRQSVERPVDAGAARSSRALTLALDPRVVLGAALGVKHPWPVCGAPGKRKQQCKQSEAIADLALQQTQAGGVLLWRVSEGRGGGEGEGEGMRGTHSLRSRRRSPA